MKALDEIDFRILKKLSSNARTPLKDLSAHAYLTTPAVSARLDKLEKEGYIKGYHAEIDLEKMGYIVKAFIMITVEPEDREKFTDFVKGEPNVIECHHITGPYSMLMQVVFTTTSALDEFLGRLQVFGKTETQVVFSTIMASVFQME